MDKKTLNSLIDEYIRTHYIPDDDDDIQNRGGGIHSLIDSILSNVAVKLAGIEKRQATNAHKNLHGRETPLIVSALGYSVNSRLGFAIDKKLKSKGETFSEMLIRLIAESGKKNSDIYNRANIKRQHFSKIMNDDEYQPSKPTVLAFAIALKLGFEKTRELLASAGYILSNAKKFDLVISACLENKFYDIYEINEILEE